MPKLQCHIPVSYTHLDVYKRQDLAKTVSVPLCYVVYISHIYRIIIPQINYAVKRDFFSVKLFFIDIRTKSWTPEIDKLYSFVHYTKVTCKLNMTIIQLIFNRLREFDSYAFDEVYGSIAVIYKCCLLYTSRCV